MIEQQGRVVEVLPAQVCIEVGPAEGCSRCASGKGCGAGLFVRLIHRKPTRLLLTASEPLQPGQVVTIGIPESLFLRWVMRLYGMPLLAAFVTAFPVQLLANEMGLSPGQTDLAVLLAAVAGFAVILFVVKHKITAGVSESSVSLLTGNSSSEPIRCMETD